MDNTDIFARITSYGDKMYQAGLITSKARYSAEFRTNLAKLGELEETANSDMQDFWDNPLLSDISHLIHAYGTQMRRTGLNQGIWEETDNKYFRDMMFKWHASADQGILDIRVKLHN